MNCLTKGCLTKEFNIQYIVVFILNSTTNVSVDWYNIYIHQSYNNLGNNLKAFPKSIH